MKAEEFKTVNDLRRLRENALIKAYEKMAAGFYELTFLPNWAQDKMSLDKARGIVDQMDEVFEAEWRHIGEMYGFSEEMKESDD